MGSKSKQIPMEPLTFYFMDECAAWEKEADTLMKECVKLKTRVDALEDENRRLRESNNDQTVIIEEYENEMVDQATAIDLYRYQLSQKSNMIRNLQQQIETLTSQLYPVPDSIENQKRNYRSKRRRTGGQRVQRRLDFNNIEVIELDTSSDSDSSIDFLNP